MKHVVYGISMFAMAVGFLLLFFVIRTRPLKEEELYVAVGRAMETTMKYYQTNVGSNTEAGKRFCALLDETLGNKGELEVEIIHIDVKKGIFRAKVTLEYRYITGQTACVTVDRTLIYEKGDEGV